MDRLTEKLVETKVEKISENQPILENGVKVQNEVSPENDVIVQDYARENVNMADTACENVTIADSAEVSSNSYLSSFETITVADVKQKEKREREKQAAVERQKLVEEELARQATERELEKEQEFAQKQQQQKKEVQSANIIEKPNYDFLEEKVVKLSSAPKKKKKSAKKKLGLLLACALFVSGVICVSNFVILDQMSSNYTQIEESYKLKLGKYLKDIYNLDATKNGMEVLETYPEELLDAGDIGLKSNWFDRLCNFIAGLFGG